MAIYYLGMKTFSRSAGKSGSRATSAAAYRAGERIRDERTGAVYDHRRRADVLYKGVVLPAHLAAKGAALGWAHDRSRLWNAAEHAETRRNARVAREFTVALPHELSPLGRKALAQRFAQHIADRFRSAVDVAIHAPRGDPRNFHAHLLTTTREITAEGLGRKTTLELTGTERHHLGLPRWRQEIASLGEHWATLANTALEREHIAARISPSRAERDHDLSAPPRLPLAAYHMEKRGQRSYVAERIREQHRVKLESTRLAAMKPSLQHEPAGGEPKPWFGRLGAEVQMAWQAVRDRCREGPAAERASLDRGARETMQSSDRGADQATGVVRVPSMLERRHTDLSKIRKSWQTESERSARLWQEFRKEQAPDPEAARLWREFARGPGSRQERDAEEERQPRREHSRDKGYGLEM